MLVFKFDGISEDTTVDAKIVDARVQSTAASPTAQAGVGVPVLIPFAANDMR